MNWSKTAPKPTLTEVVDGYIALIQQTAKDEARARSAYATMDPGDPRVGDAARDIVKARCDQRHFREYREFFSALLRRYPEHAHKPAEHAIAVSRGAKPSAPPKVLQFMQQLPSAPYVDDGEELPF